MRIDVLKHVGSPIGIQITAETPQDRILLSHLQGRRARKCRGFDECPEALFLGPKVLRSVAPSLDTRDSNAPMDIGA